MTIDWVTQAQLSKARRELRGKDKYIDKLTSRELHVLGTFAGSKWTPCDDVAEYFAPLAHSFAFGYPDSWVSAARTTKFLLWLIRNRPQIAEALGII